MSATLSNSDTESEQCPPPSTKRSWEWLLPLLFYLGLALVFLWRSTFTGEVFLPARLLGHFAPYSSVIPQEDLPLWNPLRWDGITQFYPWRYFASETIRSGTIPLWNPYQFCGTPFVANSQSAVFYPANLLFYLLPVATAFNYSALLHLTACGWFTYLFMRRLKCGQAGALIAGVVYTYSAWQVSWLQLPTFLATSCWFPLLFRQIHLLIRHEALSPSHTRNVKAGALGCIVGLMLLAGHLQIAFYGLLAGGLWAVSLLWAEQREGGWVCVYRGCLRSLLGLTLGLLLSFPQLLPSLELSRVSHRVGKPSKEGYRLYVEYAPSHGALASLFLPDFFGNDRSAENAFWGFYTKSLGPDKMIAIRHNPAEIATYVGVLTLLLGIFAIISTIFSKSYDKRILFWGGIAGLSLFMALGTPINAIFYFGVPGFGQSGSPGRVLVLWTFAWAVLSGFGLNTLVRSAPTTKEVYATLGATLTAMGFTALFVVLMMEGKLTGASYPTLSEAVGHIGSGWARLGVTVGIGILILLPLRAFAKWRTPIAIVGMIVELFAVGIFANPTSKSEYVYPKTEGIKLLQAKSEHEHIFPLNRDWKLEEARPAVLLPNGAMVYGLRDVQGYDSLFTGRYKAFSNEFALPNLDGVKDSSPIVVGNMVFFQSAVGQKIARNVISLPTDSVGYSSEVTPKQNALYNQARDMAIYEAPNISRASLISIDGTAQSTPIVWLEDSSTRVRLKLMASGDAHLVLMDEYYPGWKAYLDGKEALVSRSGAVFRSVSVPTGEHEILFRYEPASYRVGLYFALFAVTLSSLLFGFAIICSRITLTKEEGRA